MDEKERQFTMDETEIQSKYGDLVEYAKTFAQKQETTTDPQQAQPGMMLIMNLKKPIKNNTGTMHTKFIRTMAAEPILQNNAYLSFLLPMKL